MANCFKCKTSIGVVCSRDGVNKPYCNSCFLEFCTRLIRDALFKYSGMPCEEPVVIAVSGGFSSLSLLHQLGVLRLQNNIRPGNGKVNFNIIPLHLREEELVAPTLGFQNNNNNNNNMNPQEIELNKFSEIIKEQCSNLEYLIRTQYTQWEFASTPLFHKDELCVIRYSDYLSSSEIKLFQTLLHHPRLSLSDRELLYMKLRNRVLSLATIDCINKWKQTRNIQNSWYHLITGENALRCSIIALREIMTGTGVNIIHHCGYRGFINQTIILRPLRTMLPRELVLYCYLQNISFGYSPSLCTYTSLRSINRTLELFINNMMHSYRTSVFNILNTVTKLEVETVPELTRVELNIKDASQQPKRVIPGKTAQYHYEHLKITSPPRYSWFDTNKLYPIKEDDKKEGNSLLQLCLLCGCLIPIKNKHLIILPQEEEKKRFLCDACLKFIDALPDEIAAVIPLHINNNSTKQQQQEEEEEEKKNKLEYNNNHYHHEVMSEVMEMKDNGSLNIFSLLAQRLESSIEVADEINVKESTEETRSVRRRLHSQEINEYILPDDEEEDDNK